MTWMGKKKEKLFWLNLNAEEGVKNDIETWGLISQTKMWVREGREIGNAEQPCRKAERQVRKAKI